MLSSVIDVYGDIYKSNGKWTKEEELAAIAKAFRKDGTPKSKKLKEWFVETALKHNLGLVFAAFEKHCFNKSNDDVFQRGVIALAEALKKYDPSKGHRISTWCSRPVLWSFRQSQSAYGSKGGITLGEKFSAINHNKAKKAAKEIAEAEAKGESIDMKKNAALFAISIDKPIGKRDEGGNVETMANVITAKNISVDYVTANGIKTADEEVREADIKTGIDELIGKMAEFLTCNEAFVVRGVLAGRTLVDMAHELKLSRMRLSQISQNAFKKIRASAIGAKLATLV